MCTRLCLPSTFILFLVFIGTRGESTYVYLGCFLDKHPARRLEGEFKDFGKYLTQQTCIDYCKGKGYLYAGVQSSTQCFCGSHRPTSDDSRPETECNYTCSGDKSQLCGGDWRNSIYETGVRDVTRYIYLGCYIDEFPARRFIDEFKDFGKYLTQQECIEFCKGKGHLYAGLQASTQCFCGSHRPTSDDSRPETECNKKCSGDPFRICGGDWRNSVYETGLKGGNKHVYLGCYFDEEPGRRLVGDLKDFGKYLTQETCIDYCKGKGYKYAGVQSSTQCFCGDQRPTTNDSRPETECNYKCTGDQSIICGGHWRNSIFVTGLKGGNKYIYLGCYIDQHPARRLIGDFKDFGKHLTQETCINYCKDKGHKYAGVQSSTQCFCGDQRPTTDDLRPETDCNYKCTGDQALTCGGDWRNSIYETGLEAGNKYVYLGCYFDEDPGRRLISDYKDFGKYLTQQTCIDYCKGKGHNYAGLQASHQCFCGNQRPFTDDLRPETECNYKCTGDQSLTCGGNWRNSIYKTGPKGGNNYIYLGCYFDKDPGRRLIGDFKDFGKYLTQETCIDYCKSKGYKYAGVQSSTQCFCGDQTPTTDDSRPEAECNYKCTGDQSLICGGDWRNSIYEIVVKDGTSSNYLGCYYDEYPARRLIGDYKDFGKELTQQNCIDFCKDKGYPYAGAQYGHQCFCGDPRPVSDDLRPETECDSKCNGDQSLICGGGWRSSVFETGVTEALIIDKRYEYVGCFMDQEPRSLTGYYIDLGDSSSPENCIALCKRKGYVYAGLQVRSQCFCGDERPTKPGGVHDCKHKCIGDKRFNCGSDWRNSVYKTGNSDPLKSDSKYQYLGCYIDQEHRELRGPVQDMGNQNSPERCVTSCKEKGYVYAGLQTETKCYCGDKDPKPENLVTDKECKYKCPGDYKYICGGDWRNTVYKTGHPGASVALAGYEYMGCYRDQAEPQLLRGEMLDYPETLTPSLCVGVCQKKGYVFAGLQSSSHCFCGDNEVTHSYKVNEEECHMKCTGDRTAICGGVWRLTLYRTGNKAPSIAKLPDNEYVGCYKDQVDPKLLRGHMQDFPETLTPQLCVALCKRKGYIYAGLQASSKCFCGDEELPASAKVSDSNCLAKCTGDRSVFCGGAWRNTIYKTGNSGSSVANIGYMYIGCYRDLSYPRKLSGFMADYPETLTPQHCVTVCKRKEFQFAGLQLGFQCFCGNELPSILDKKPESECNSKCSGDLTSVCGGVWKNTIYSTASRNNDNIKNECITSVTRVNGKAACHSEVVLEDNFDTLSYEMWNHVVQIPNDPDYEFVVYKSDPANAYIEDGKLVIKPTLLPDTEVLSGDLHLINCTGKLKTNECGYKAKSFIILPPVQSARLTTRKSFSFQYGKVEISAKLPAGDWLVPEIWLESKNEVYGPGYASGKVRIAMSRGNNDLKLDGKDIGCRQLQSGILIGVGDNIKSRTVIRETSEGWHKDYHNYTVIWTPENILFTVDGEQPYYLFPSGGQTLPEAVGFSPTVTPVWSSASKIAPFDNDERFVTSMSHPPSYTWSYVDSGVYTEYSTVDVPCLSEMRLLKQNFYVSLGLTVGGIRTFPDNIINHGKQKPWKNLELKGMLNFWRDKRSWQPTWHDDTALLKIDHIKVTAL